MKWYHSTVAPAGWLVLAPGKRRATVDGADVAVESKQSTFGAGYHESFNPTMDIVQFVMVTLMKRFIQHKECA